MKNSNGKYDSFMRMLQMNPPIYCNALLMLSALFQPLTVLQSKPPPTSQTVNNNEV